MTNGECSLSGYPVIVPNGVTVEPVFRLKRVDLSTGNLHFKGSLEIAGDVTEGMEVTATEQLTVGGIVEAARLQAGGDIVVMGGVIGHAEPSRSDGGRETAHISAGGSVSVHFAENAVITAGGAIVIKELAMQCDLTSGSSITVGEQGARRGHIIGGCCRAATLVEAVVLGSRVGVATVVEVGVVPSLHRKLETVKDAMAEKERLMEELSKTLSYVRENPGTREPELVQLKERGIGVHGEFLEKTKNHPLGGFGKFDLAGFPKDRFYSYKSFWTAQPTVHVFPHWNWAGHEGEKIPVMVYTNAQEVELFLKNTRGLLPGPAGEVTEPDVGPSDKIQAQVFYRPCYIGRI